VVNSHTPGGTLQGAPLPSNCGVFFIGDYIGVVSTNTSVHILYTWNGPHAMDVYESNLS
jgi:hypothetical protein